MGCYDTVIVGCPRCGSRLEVQTKAGDCDLREYALAEAPPEILAALAAEAEKCRACGAVCRFRVTVLAVPYVAEGVPALEMLLGRRP